jgi:hypothetical protein
VVLPKPIPGGSTLPDDTLIHVLGPGPSDIKLPFSGGFLGGDDVDTVTITDFEGFSAVAFHAGTALGTDGAMYNLETDMRAFQGRYIGEDGDVHEGCFTLFESISMSPVRAHRSMTTTWAFCPQASFGRPH